jgi:hypothetical protein
MVSGYSRSQFTIATCAPATRSRGDTRDSGSSRRSSVESLRLPLSSSHRGVGREPPGSAATGLVQLRGHLRERGRWLGRQPERAARAGVASVGRADEQLGPRVRSPLAAGDEHVRGPQRRPQLLEHGEGVRPAVERRARLSDQTPPCRAEQSRWHLVEAHLLAPARVLAWWQPPRVLSGPRGCPRSRSWPAATAGTGAPWRSGRAARPRSCHRAGGPGARSRPRRRRASRSTRRTPRPAPGRRGRRGPTAPPRRLAAPMRRRRLRGGSRAPSRSAWPRRCTRAVRPRSRS